MITRSQGDQILELVDEMIEVTTDEDLAPSYEVRDRLRACVDALVRPETYDADALRGRIQAINASARGGPAFRWEVEPLAPTRPTDLRPRDYSALDAPPAPILIETRDDLGRPTIEERITLTDQERAEIERPADDTLKEPTHEPPKQNRTKGHHGGN